jgi:hypothetical protein
MHASERHGSPRLSEVVTGGRVLTAEGQLTRGFDAEPPAGRVTNVREVAALPQVHHAILTLTLGDMSHGISEWSANAAGLVSFRSTNRGDSANAIEIANAGKWSEQFPIAARGLLPMQLELFHSTL